MARPYLDTYENEDGDMVIVYIPEVNVMTQVEPEHIVIKAGHISELLSCIDEFIGEANG